MKSSRDKLMDRLKDSQNELDKVRAERAKLLEIMVNKVTVDGCDENILLLFSLINTIFPVSFIY
jgi:hypothetical protein